MPLMLKQFVLPIADLSHLVWKCSTCQTEIAIDLNYVNKSEHPLKASSIVIFCPVCGTQWNSERQQVIDNFRRAYQNLKTISELVTSFRLKTDEPTTESTSTRPDTMETWKKLTS